MSGKGLIGPERHVSHETIYTAIYAQPRGDLRRQLIACGQWWPRVRSRAKKGPRELIGETLMKAAAGQTAQTQRI